MARSPLFARIDWATYQALSDTVLSEVQADLPRQQRISAAVVRGVYVALRFHQGVKDHCWPSERLLGVEADTSERNARKALRVLMAVDLVFIVRTDTRARAYQVFPWRSGQTFTPQRFVSACETGRQWLTETWRLTSEERKRAAKMRKQASCREK